MAPTSLKQHQASDQGLMLPIKTGEGRALQVLREITQGTAPLTGAAFFPGLVRHIGQTFGVKYVYLSELVREQPGILRVIASWENGKNGFGFELKMANTPCARVVTEGIFVVPEGLTEEYPNDHFFKRIGAESYVGVPILDGTGETLGHICVLDDQRLREETVLTSTLTLVAVRAAAERFRGTGGAPSRTRRMPASPASRVASAYQFR